MAAKVILGCAYCEGHEDDGELRMCCWRHGRLVCSECAESAPFRLEHPAAA